MRFRLKTLLIVVSLICVLLAAILVPLTRYKRERQAILWFEGLGGDVRTEKAAFSGLIESLGGAPLEYATYLSLKRTPTTDADLKRVTSLSNLKVLYLDDTKISD